MKYKAKASTEEFGGSVAATEKFLYDVAWNIGEAEDRMIRGLYYSTVKDPFTGYSMIIINVWFT